MIENQELTSLPIPIQCESENQQSASVNRFSSKIAASINFLELNNNILCETSPSLQK
jgi:hypothetical protein